MKNWIKVFGFTFRRMTGTKGYIITTVLVAALLLFGISGGMALIEMHGGNDAAEEIEIARAVIVGNIELYTADTPYSDVIFENAPNVDAAAKTCDGDSAAVILLAEDDCITAIIPEGSDIDYTTAMSMAAFFAEIQTYMQAEAPADDMPVYTTTQPEAEEIAESDGLETVIGFVVPYLVVMLMYFMVLIYGQSIANEAIMEKTSKLMDMFLVSVKPGAMMLGKVLAGAAAGLLQTLVWIFSAVGGCALGIEVVKRINPATDMPIIALFEGVGGIGAMLSPAALITAALVIISGFLVYCGLAGVGGALASKPEDLASSNYLFTLALMLSFFACLFTGESAGMISDAAWMAYVPFTSALVMPGRLLTGAATVAEGFVSVGISAVFAVAVCALAGKAYAMLAFYRGKPMNPIKFIRSLIK